MTGLITDPGFNLNRTEEYKVSIQVSQDGFSFSVIHEKENKLLALEYFPLLISSDTFLERHFESWIDNNDILQKKYSNTRITYYTEKFTLIPSAYNDNTNHEITANLVFGIQTDKVITDNYLPNAAGNIIFPVSKNIVEIVNSKFPENKLLHPLSILDTRLHNLTKMKEVSMLLYFERKSFSMFLYKDSKLLVTNSFESVNSDDVIYYTLSALKKIKAEYSKASVYLAGEIFLKSTLHFSLKKFFYRTIFFTPDVLFNSNIFKEPLHRFIVLF